eukprot:TRINITY_DN20055_c0_g1_i1.p1 TRINITY_DN20055_c0_g1~~TRINITY_DN20055_c0_g1_i1.p1  ORF type:complete len:379 (+),score=73.78 TRINITY_DN20055_c0_g1_i1:38-1138(+)
MMRLVGLVLVLCCLVSSQSPLTNTPIASGDYQFSSSLLGGEIVVYWNIESDVLSVGVIAQTTGWVGIGFGSNSMTNADIFIGMVTAGTVTVNDYWSTAEGQPSLDTAIGGTDSVLESAGVEDNGFTHIKFRRNMAAQDANADLAISTTGETGVIVAMGTTDTLAQHAGGSRVGASINFASGASMSGLNTGQFQLAHSVFMVLGWGFFATAGILIARFGHAHKLWFKIHIGVMTGAMVFSLIGFILAIFSASSQFTQTTNIALAHAWIGLFVVVGGLSQPIIGFIADRKFDPNRDEAPIWPDKIHWYVGRYSYLFGAVNILLGMCVIGANRAYFVLYAIWMIICMAGYHYLDVGKGRIVDKIKGSHS